MTTYRTATRAHPCRLPRLRGVGLLALVLAGSAPALHAQQPVRAGGHIRSPVKVKNVYPRFPEDARKKGRPGFVVIEATIGTDGKVSNITGLYGAEDFIRSAEVAIRGWRYQPTTLNGKRVPVIIAIKMAFFFEDWPRNGAVAGAIRSANETVRWQAIDWLVSQAGKPRFRLEPDEGEALLQLRASCVDKDPLCTRAAGLLADAGPG